MFSRSVNYNFLTSDGDLLFSVVIFNVVSDAVVATSHTILV